ncbi:MAG: DnaJ domain-containing protein [Methanosarcinaceae archaeon]|nr:DnaJ domain-containing protein [Methanosarcinaceae archaeon]
MSTPDHYTVLGISPNASAADIKKRYRDLMIKYHPDRNNSPDAEEKAKMINEAYSVLSDPMKRSEYDHRLSEPWLHSQQRKAYRASNQRTTYSRTYTWTYDPSSGRRGRQGKSANPFRNTFGLFLKMVSIIVLLWVLLHFAILTIGVILTLLVFYLLWILLTELLYLVYGRR